MRNPGYQNRASYVFVSQKAKRKTLLISIRESSSYEPLKKYQIISGIDYI